MEQNVQLLFSHHALEQRGHLWLGHWPPPLRQELGPLLQPLSLREGQAELLRIEQRVAQSYRDLWDRYWEALKADQPPPPEIDFSAEPSPSLAIPLTPSFEPPIGSFPLDSSARCRPRLA